MASKKKYFCPDEYDDFQRADMEINWGIERSTGYNMATLRVVSVNDSYYPHRAKQASCSGGGYSFVGTVLAEWMQNGFSLEDQLRKVGPLADAHVRPGGGGCYTRPHITRVEGHGLILAPREAQLYGAYVQLNEETLLPEEYIRYGGAAGDGSMQNILSVLGYSLTWIDVRAKKKDTLVLKPNAPGKHIRHDHKVLLLSGTHELVFVSSVQPAMPEDLDSEDWTQWYIDNTAEQRVVIAISSVNDLGKLLDRDLGEQWNQAYSYSDGIIKWTNRREFGRGEFRSVRFLHEESEATWVRYFDLIADEERETCQA